MRVGAEQPSDILNHHQLRPELGYGVGHVRPQPRPRVGAQASAFPGTRDVLTRKSTYENVHGVHIRPVNGRNITKVRNAGPVILQDFDGCGLYLAEPHGTGVEDAAQAHSEPVVAGE